MTNRDDISYMETEVLSHLPSGWDLVDGAGAWDGDREAWVIRVIDEVDFDWDVAIRPDKAEKLGRMEALRQAMDRVQRGRLGWRTKGLLGWRLKRA